MCSLGAVVRALAVITQRGQENQSQQVSEGPFQSSPACDRGLLMRGRDHIHCMSDGWKGRLTLAYTCSLVPQLRPPTVSSNIRCKSARALPPPPGRLWQDLEQSTMRKEMQNLERLRCSANRSLVSCFCPSPAFSLPHSPDSSHLEREDDLFQQGIPALGTVPGIDWKAHYLNWQYLSLL